MSAAQTRSGTASQGDMHGLSGQLTGFQRVEPEYQMAKNSGRGFRRGAVTRRSQTRNPLTGGWTKRDTGNGMFVDAKSDKAPFKGVRKEARG